MSLELSTWAEGVLVSKHDRMWLDRDLRQYGVAYVEVKQDGIGRRIYPEDLLVTTQDSASLRYRTTIQPKPPTDLRSSIQRLRTAKKEKPMSDFAWLRYATVQRQAEWPGAENITASFRGLELAGEVGEACNVVKKLERSRLGLSGTKSTPEALAEELADVIICTDLLAMEYGIDLWAAVIKKFDASSDKLNLKTKLSAVVADFEEAAEIAREEF